MSKETDYFDDLINKKLTYKEKKDKNNELLENLLKIPKRDRGVNMPKTTVFESGLIQQADLLTLPNDDGFRYALVVVDLADRKTDAEPLKSKQSSDVVKAFKKIYNRGILTVPQRIEVDSGTEFKGETIEYFKNLNVFVRVAKAGRHRQQSTVERRNQLIGRYLLKRMQAQELLTGETSTEWVEDLPKLIKALNRKKMRVQKNVKNHPVCNGDSCNLLPIGTKVRVMLDEPREIVYGQKLHGKFRTGDVRFDPTERTIKQIMMRPNFPPLYLLDGKFGQWKVDNVSYTKNQLQVIPKNEKYPDASVIRGNPKTYIPIKILEKRKVKNKIQYLVTWRGFKDPTWETAAMLKQDVPHLLKKFEEDQAKKNIQLK